MVYRGWHRFDHFRAFWRGCALILVFAHLSACLDFGGSSSDESAAALGVATGGLSGSSSSSAETGSVIEAGSADFDDIADPSGGTNAETQASLPISEAFLTAELGTTVISEPDTAGIVTIQGEGFHFSYFVQVTDVSAVKRDEEEAASLERSGAVTGWWRGIKARLMSWVGSFVGEAVAQEDEDDPCGQAHTVCVEVVDDGTLLPAPLAGVMPGDEFDVNYIDPESGAVSLARRDQIFPAFTFLGSTPATSLGLTFLPNQTSGSDKLLQITDDGQFVRVKFDDAAGFLFADGGEYDEGYRLATYEPEDGASLKGLFFSSILNGVVVWEEHMVNLIDGKEFLSRREASDPIPVIVSSRRLCEGDCGTTQVKMAEGRAFFSTKFKLPQSTGEIIELTDELRPPSYLEFANGTINVDDMGAPIEVRETIAFDVVGPKEIEASSPAVFGFDDGRAIVLAVFKDQDGQDQIGGRYVGVEGSLPVVEDFRSAPSAITGLTIFAPQPLDDSRDGYAAILGDGKMQVIVFDLLDDVDEAVILMSKDLSLVVGSNPVQTYYDVHTRKIFVLSLESKQGPDHYDKIFVVDVSELGGAEGFARLNYAVDLPSDLDPDHDGVIDFETFLGGKKIAFQAMAMVPINTSKGKILVVSSGSYKGLMPLPFTLPENADESGDDESAHHPETGELPTLPLPTDTIQSIPLGNAVRPEEAVNPAFDADDAGGTRDGEGTPPRL